MRTSLFLSSRKMATWTAKTMMATTKAPRNALRLIPAKPWALPALPSGSSEGVLAGELDADVDDRMLDDTNDAVADVRLDESVVDIVEPAVGSWCREVQKGQPPAGKSVVRGQLSSGARTAPALVSREHVG